MRRTLHIIIFVLLVVLSVLAPSEQASAFEDDNAYWASFIDGDGGEITTIRGFLGRVSGIIDLLIPFIISLALLVILWGIFTYLTKAEEEEKRAEAKLYIIWGVIGIFFMVSLWGFVNILLNTFELKKQIDPGDIPKVPQLEE